MRRPAWLLLSGALAFAVAPVAAQARLLTETRLNLRQDPSTANSPIRVLQAGDLLVRLDAGPATSRFVRVRTSRPDTGWVALDFVYDADADAATLAPFPRVIGLDQPAAAIDANWERPPIVSSSFTMSDGNSCGPRGTAGTDWRTHRRKNRNDAPAVSFAVRWQALSDLPLLLAQAKPRSGWLAADSVAVAEFEGIPLTVTGFIAKISNQKGNREATNCNATGEANTDWHMALVRTPTAPESTAVVVEPTPRFKRRHPNWTEAELAPWVGAARDAVDSVRITGYLFYDPSHRNHLGRFRRTLWELHPITRIEVFDHALGVWVDLDDR